MSTSRHGQTSRKPTTTSNHPQSISSGCWSIKLWRLHNTNNTMSTTSEITIEEQTAKLERHNKTLATVDGYLEFLSESTPFEEEGVISRTEHRDFAVRLWEAALECGARRDNTIQVCASNCGFYRLEFNEHPDEGYTTVTTVDFTPEW